MSDEQVGKEQPKKARLGGVKSWLGIIGALASIAGLVWGWYYFSKDLTVRLVTMGPHFPTDTSSEFQISYKGKEIENLGVFLLEVENTGRVPIKADDFDLPLIFDLSGIEEILSVGQQDAETSPVELVLLHGDNDLPSATNVGIAPLLLNPGDSARFIVRASCPKKPELGVRIERARIAGISEIEIQSLAEERQQQQRTTQRIVFALLLTGLLSLFICGVFTGRGMASRKFEGPINALADEIKEIKSVNIQNRRIVDAVKRHWTDSERALAEEKSDSDPKGSDT